MITQIDIQDTEKDELAKMNAGALGLYCDEVSAYAVDCVQTLAAEARNKLKAQVLTAVAAQAQRKDQDRVRKEKLELDERRERVFAFMDSEDFQELSPKDKNLMDNQYTSMTVYSSILGHRIARFNRDSK